MRRSKTKKVFFSKSAIVRESAASIYIISSFYLVKPKSISRFIIQYQNYVVVKPNTFTKSFIFRSLQKSSKWDIILCGMYLFLQESVKDFFKSANSLLMKGLGNFSNQSYRVYHFKILNIKWL